jgi:hypothetical protein
MFRCLQGNAMLHRAARNDMIAGSLNAALRTA